ncbi:MAG: hypothetical protein CM15mP74_08100 [Halieaceae bacterium]|nr:MAG: hypothetical protein CM15mP74_08100 [Halieaceae bacterium]
MSDTRRSFGKAAAGAGVWACTGIAQRVGSVVSVPVCSALGCAELGSAIGRRCAADVHGFVGLLAVCVGLGGDRSQGIAMVRVA